MKVRVDDERCVGHGRCYELAEEVFSEDERGRCVVRRLDVPAALEALARQGAANCPERAISVED